MAINFPDSPSDGQTFMSGGTQYTFINGAWRPAVGTALPRNYIVNPAMQVSLQNGNTAIADATGQLMCMADQWIIVNNTGDYVLATGQRVQVRTPNGSADRVRTTTTGGQNPINGEWSFTQKLEGNRIADLRWGTAAAKQVVIRFGLKAPAGTFSIKVGNNGVNRSYIAPFTITAGQANTDTVQTFVIPGCTDGTWKTDTSGALNLAIVMCGNFVAPTANTWLTAGNYNSMSGQTNGGRPVGTVWEFFDVGLYADPNKTGRAPPWDRQSDRQVVTDCQRYWSKLMVGRGNATATTTASRLGGPFMTTMRVNPTLAEAGSVTLYDGSVNNALATIGTTWLTETSCEFSATGTGLTVARPVAMVNNQQTNYIACSARM